ncbi:hypothetical protein N183_28100 [Sinorhizobium sp. Sb3]|uniref:hypothetical protein n=1 Tax=Sinorhizobium sp. Sb3 TaxID=1358417 RepID=UPI00071CC984|nr:hypothetical protein [Sinorhizobium sp. Sb3]KSV71050.1 hypothetical protein N183_28100 [Sinorhizobium sp. Sb3]
MAFTTNSTALLPHEINQIFQEIVRERSLSRDSEVAEEIARRLIVCYQKGIRDSSALKDVIGFGGKSEVQ